MRRYLLSLTAIAIATMTLPATAADIRRPPPPRETVIVPSPVTLFDWNGFYAGINGGWGWGRSGFDFVGGGLGNTAFDTSGGLIGGTLGFNLQAGQVVFGLEGDLAWTNLRGSSFCPVGVCETRNSWLGTARGRLGYAFDRFLPYVTAGAAFGDVKATVPGLGTASDTKVGWTAGAGVEYAVSRNWSVKAEYLYVDLGKFDCGAACGAPPPTDVRFNTHILRAGLNLRF